jgi:hypothetical protein
MTGRKKEQRKNGKKEEARNWRAAAEKCIHNWHNNLHTITHPHLIFSETFLEHPKQSFTVIKCLFVAPSTNRKTRLTDGQKEKSRIHARS